MIPINNAITTYSLTLPSTGKKIQYRPFLEKERKLMLMAVEANNKEDTLLAIKNIIVACCPGINIDQLALFDIEYIFINLRAKSISEIIKLNYRCENSVGTNVMTPCGNIMHPEIDITTAVVEGLKTDLKIKFSPTFGVKMKYPTLSLFEHLVDIKSTDYLYQLVANCIDYIWDGDNVYYTKDYPFSDVTDFIMQLTHPQFQKLEDFVSEIPTVKKTFIYTCPKCKYEHTSTIEGYQSFFF